MSVAVDIVRAWRAPRQAMHRQLADGVREDRALIYVIAACLLIFIAQFPRLWRDSVQNPELSFDMRVGATMLGWVFLAPLALYIIAALSHVLAKPFGGQGTWFSARLALFWSLLVAAPIWLLNGFVSVLAGQGLIANIFAATALLVFILVWCASFIEAERKRPD